MILTRRYIIWILLGLITGVLNQQVIPVVSGTDDNTVGYTLQSSPEGIEVYALTQNGFDASPLIVMEGFTIDGQDAALWNIFDRNTITFSPDRRKLAFLASQNNSDGTLFVLDFASLIIQQTEIEFASMQMLTTLRWLPDSTLLYINPSTDPRMFPIIYDLAQDMIIYAFDDFVASLTWLPDSQGLIFKRGRSIHHLDMLTLTESTLAEISTSDLGIVDSGATAPFQIGLIAYAPDLERVFFTYAEVVGGSIPRDPVLLASIDLSGQIRSEANLTDLYSDDLQMVEMESFYNSDLGSIYIVIRMETTGNSGFRWSVIRIVPDFATQILYEKIANLFDEQLITSIQVSPDGDYLALGASGLYDPTGSVTVVDLVTGSEVWSTETAESVCSLYWSSNDRVVYGQSEGTRCPFRRDNLPASVLIEHDLTTKLSSILRHEPGRLQYYISVFP